MDAIRDEIKKLREDFTKGTLSEADVKANPFEQFEIWLAQAVEAKITEVQATTLSTITSDNKPSSRIVYMREFENNNFFIYSNYNSQKAIHISKNNNVTLNFFWPELERQLRVEGTITKCDAKRSDNYFNSRPEESKLSAWASSQSSELKSRKELEDLVESFRKKFEGKEIPRPDFWGGYVITANYYEFWQGRKSRLHDRICYKKENEGWKIFRLAP